MGVGGGCVVPPSSSDAFMLVDRVCIVTDQPFRQEHKRKPFNGTSFIVFPHLRPLCHQPAQVGQQPKDKAGHLQRKGRENGGREKTRGGENSC